LTRASIRDRLVAGDLDDVRVVVEVLAQEFDIVDVAAAAVKVAHVATTGDEQEQDIPAEPEPRGARGPAARERPVKRHPIDGQGVRLYIGAGRRAGIRPADLVGAITGEAGVPSRALGAIEIADRFSLVEVPDDLADGIIAAMQKALLRGQKVTVRRDRERA
jgi:ATP-dependent RNA helicase DeaD